MTNMKLGLAVILAICVMGAVPALAQGQASGTPQESGAGTAGNTSNISPRAPSADIQRTNPPTSSNRPANLSGNPPGANTGTSGAPAQHGASEKPGQIGREVPRSDSAR